MIVVTEAVYPLSQDVAPGAFVRQATSEKLRTPNVYEEKNVVSYHSYNISVCFTFIEIFHGRQTVKAVEIQ